MVDEQVKLFEVLRGRQWVVGILQVRERDLDIVVVFGQAGLVWDLWNSSHRAVRYCASRVRNWRVRQKVNRKLGQDGNEGSLRGAGMETQGIDLDGDLFPCDRDEWPVDGKVLKMNWPFDEKATVRWWGSSLWLLCELCEQMAGCVMWGTSLLVTLQR